ncbi:MAG: MFS transporter [Chloroflexi bacterium]|nr:MFS transporter [Chloroflexota bacterium]
MIVHNKGKDEPRERGFEVLLHNRSFALLWISQIFSQTAQNATYFVQMVLIEEITASSTQMSLMIVAFSLPPLLFSTISGVLIDRFSKKTILLACAFSRVILIASFIPIRHALVGGPLMLALYGLTFVASTIGQLSDPAESATASLLVERRYLLMANSLFHMLFTTTQLFGMLLFAPFLVKLGGVDFAFAVIALSYLITATLIAFIQVREIRREQYLDQRTALNRILSDLSEGWTFIRTQPRVRIAIAHLGLVSFLVISVASLAPGFAARVLGRAPSDALYIFLPAGIGMLLSTFLLGRFGHHVAREKLIHGGFAVGGMAILALALVVWGRGMPGRPALGPITGTTIKQITLFSVLLGSAMTVAAISAQTALQESTPPRLRGRVIAVQFLTTSAASLPPMLFIGNMADRVGIPPVILLIATVVLLWAVVNVRYGSTARIETVPKWQPVPGEQPTDPPDES